MPMAALPIATLALTAVGTGIAAIGTIHQGQAQAATANYQAQVSANNAIVAKQNAEAETQAGEAKAEATSLASRTQMGTILAGQSASGVDVESPSSVDVRATNRAMRRLDEETAIHDAALRAYGYRTQGTSFEATAGLQRAEAAQAPVGAGLSAAGSLIGGAGTVANRFSWMNLNAGGGGGGGVYPGD